MLRVLLALLAVTLAAGEARRPNIVVVITDDQGYGELSCHGNPVLKTPSLDRLHAQSVRFTDFNVSPTCSPTRAALMTGRHEFRSGVTHTNHERERLALSATTFPQLLSAAGYATGIFGKWHLGDEAAYQPGKRGFGEVFIHGAGGIGQTYPGSCGDAPGNRYQDPWVLHNGRFVKTSGFCTDVFVDQAAGWIASQAQAGTPFLAWIATNAPHAPFDQCPAAWSKPYRDAGLDGKLADYYGMIANIDAAVGRLLDRLDALKIADDTLVVFLTDNGHPFPKAFNAGMRGGKATPDRGGTRVPSLWRLPSRFAGGRDVAALTAHIDVFPTLCDVAGVAVPPGLAIEGRSLLPLLDDPAAPWPDRHLFTHVGRWPQGKAATAQYRTFSVRSARWLLVGTELFDIAADPGQTSDVAAANPAVVAAHRAAYDAWWSSVQSGLVNEDAKPPAENPYKVWFREQVGK